jgi:phosphate uptake regulator
MGSFFINLSEEVVRTLMEGQMEDSRNIDYRAREVDKIYSLLVRQLVQGVRSQQVASRVGLSDVIQCLGSRMVAKALRDLTRSMYKISGIAEQAHLGPADEVKQTADLVVKLKSIYMKAYDSLLREDIKKAAEVLRDQEAFNKEVTGLEKTLSKLVEGPGTSALIPLVRELEEASHSVAILPEVAVNRYVERE